jgi:hypothetical protein
MTVKAEVKTLATLMRLTKERGGAMALSLKRC